MNKRPQANNRSVLENFARFRESTDATLSCAKNHWTLDIGVLALTSEYEYIGSQSQQMIVLASFRFTHAKRVYLMFN